MKVTHEFGLKGIEHLTSQATQGEREEMEADLPPPTVGGCTS
jgi:hypothetical protein